MECDCSFDVILVNPPFYNKGNGKFSFCENLALAFLSSYLKSKGVSTYIVDCDLDNFENFSVLARFISSKSPKLVGVTSLAKNSEDAVKIADEISNVDESIDIVFGGQHFTFCAENLLKVKKQDYFVIRGEGEEALFKLFKEIETGKRRFNDVPGLVYKDNGFVLKSSCKLPIESLDELPFPDRSVTFRAIEKGMSPALPVLSSRGCYAPCVFCNAQKIYNEAGGRPWRARSASNVILELQEILSMIGEKIDPVILFYDDTFIGPGKRGQKAAAKLGEEISKKLPDLKYEAFIRANSICDSPILVKTLADSGLVRVFMGIESGDDAELSMYRKIISTEQIENAFSKLKKNRISTPSSGFIMFHPFSTFPTLRKNSDFLRKIGHASLYNMSVKLDIYGGNEFVNMAKEYDLITGTTCFGGVHQYRFIDENVGKLAEYMDITGHPVLERQDTVARSIDYESNTIFKELEALGLVYDHSLVRKMEKCFDEIQELSYTFFSNSIDMFQSDRTQNSDKLKEELFVALDNALDRLEEEYKNYLVSINHIISGEVVDNNDYMGIAVI